MLTADKDEPAVISLAGVVHALRMARLPEEIANMLIGRMVAVAAKEAVERERRCYRPDHNGECLNCDEPADVHECPNKGSPWKSSPE